MSTLQDLQQEVERLSAQLAERDQELAFLKAMPHAEQPTRRAAIVRVEQAALDTHAAETFDEALHVLALQARLVVGAHQSAISYVPDGDFKAAIHTHSFSEKYERYDTYDVMPTGEGMWALVVKNRSPVRLTEDEVYSHPQFKNFSGLKDARGLEHPPMPGWLAVPILGWDGVFLGVIQLSDRFEGDFTEDDQEQLLNLATLFAPTFELEHVNERLQVQAASLSQATLELQRSNAELEQFASVASHDLQQPLRVISSYLQLLSDKYSDSFDGDAKEFMAFAVDGATRMQILIDDLLRYSMVGNQGNPFEPTDCNLVVDRVLADLDAVIKESGAKINRNSLPTISADASQLGQLFQNLIGNALKFHGQEPPDIRIRADLNDGSWLFSVSDNGIGIDPRHADRIFEIFERLHGRGKYLGTGDRTRDLQEDRREARRTHLGCVGARDRVDIQLHASSSQLIIGREGGNHHGFGLI